VIKRPVNTLRQCVEVIPQVVSNGSVRFEAKDTERSISEVPRGYVMIQVDYSSALPFKLNQDVSAYVCVGRDLATGERMVALSSINSSYITCPSSQTSSLQGAVRSSLMILRQLIRCFAALISLPVNSYHGKLILVDPDLDFARCLVDIVAPSASASHRVVIMGTRCGPEGKFSLPRFSFISPFHFSIFPFSSFILVISYTHDLKKLTFLNLLK
jgi:hypothetical protein